MLTQARYSGLFAIKDYRDSINQDDFNKAVRKVAESKKASDEQSSGQKHAANSLTAGGKARIQPVSERLSIKRDEPTCADGHSLGEGRGHQDIESEVSAVQKNGGSWFRAPLCITNTFQTPCCAKPVKKAASGAFAQASLVGYNSRTRATW